MDRKILKSSYFRLNLTIPPDLDSRLEGLGSYARQTGGYKLPKTLIIRSLIRLTNIIPLDTSGVKTEDELLKRLVKACKVYSNK